jgi:glycosyltransferase involved in cell wall biosynthesis
MAKRLGVLVASLAKGGIGKMRVHLVNELIRQGVEVDVLMARADSPYLDMLSGAARQVLLGTSHEWASVLPIARYLRRVRPDALLAQRVRVNVAALRARRLARTGTPIFATLNTSLSHQLASARPGKRRKQLAYLRRYYPRNDGLIAISQGVAEDAASLIGVPREAIRVISNPVVTGRIAELAQAPVAHRWLAEGGSPVILGAGRLEPQKDFPTLIRAFAEARGARPLRLVILGEGAQRASLLDLAAALGVAGDVDLPGFVDNPYAYMARAAVFVLSSAWEGFGNVLAEALAVGIPVVATDCPSGPSEILEGGRWGRLVRVGDAAGLARAVLETLADPLPAASLRESAQRFTVEASARGYLEAMGLA